MADAVELGDSLVSPLKEQLLLFSFLVVFVGMISTDTYYAAFGVKYQFLDLPIEHLVYRGITAVLQSFWLAAVYLVAIGWLAGLGPFLLAKRPAWRRDVMACSHGLIVGIVCAAYFAAISVGSNAAWHDMNVHSSELPLIQKIIDKKGNTLDFEGFRLLVSGKDSVAIFKPVTTIAEVPSIHLMNREEIGEIIINR